MHLRFLFVTKMGVSIILRLSKVDAGRDSELQAMLLWALAFAQVPSINVQDLKTNERDKILL